MTSFILRRLFMTLPVVLGVVVFTFAILHMTPGDPAQIIAGPSAPASVIEEIRQDLGLDRPLHVQFTEYVGNLVSGDMGRSIISRRSVAGEIARTFPNTLEVVVLTIAVTAAVGIPLGIIAARNRGTVVDSAVMILALVGLTMPVFSIGLALMWLFGFQLQWLPIGGRGGELWTVDGLRHLILPVTTLAAFGMGIVARLTRTTMLEVLASDYVRTAKSKGLPGRVVVLKHALKNASLPIITVMGLQFGTLLGGAVVTETVFGWPGIGRLLIQAILRQDFPIVQGVVLILALSFVLINLVVDLLYGYLDPRIQYS